jgi:hypothetical protein
MLENSLEYVPADIWDRRRCKIQIGNEKGFSDWLLRTWLPNGFP